MDPADVDGKSEVITSPSAHGNVQTPCDPHQNSMALLTETKQTPHRLDGTAGTPSALPSWEGGAGARRPFTPLHCGAAATETPRGAQADAGVETGHGAPSASPNRLCPRRRLTRPQTLAKGGGEARPGEAGLGQRRAAPRGASQAAPTLGTLPRNPPCVLGAPQGLSPG